MTAFALTALAISLIGFAATVFLLVKDYRDRRHQWHS
jgi:hypothetical protein